MTRTVACLEEAGLVTRRPHDTDGRQVVVELTAAARDVLADDRRRRDAWLAQRLGALDADELELLHRVAPLLERLAGDMRSTFAALRVRNYRLFASGALVSNVGTWMQRVAQDWLILTLTGSAGALGLTTGLQFLPILLFSPFAGVIADRYPKRRILAITQATMAATAAMLGVLAVTGLVQPWHVYVLAFLFGTGHGVRRPRPPGVRQRDGRPRPAGQRGRPQLGVVQPRPHDRPGARRRPHRLDGLGRRGDRLGDPGRTPAATSPSSSRWRGCAHPS